MALACNDRGGQKHSGEVSRMHGSSLRLSCQGARGSGKKHGLMAADLPKAVLGALVSAVGGTSEELSVGLRALGELAVGDGDPGRFTCWERVVKAVDARVRALPERPSAEVIALALSAEWVLRRMAADATSAEMGER